MVEDITADKPYLLQCVFGVNAKQGLTRVWRTIGIFTDLPKSLTNAQALTSAAGDHSFRKVFWDQFGDNSRTPLLADKMKQLMELHRMAGPALQNLSTKLWLTDAIPTSYFGLICRLVEALAQVDVWKHSACIEGAQQAFAHFKMHIPMMGCERVATGVPPEGKAQRKPEMYMEDALKGAQQIEKICSKEKLFP
jgi:hypothetical protein